MFLEISRQKCVLRMLLSHSKGGILIFLSAFAHTFIKLIEIEAIYEVSHVNVKVERGSTVTFTHCLSYVASILFLNANFTPVRT